MCHLLRLERCEIHHFGLMTLNSKLLIWLSKKLARLHFPDVILGVYTDDELQDSQGIVDVTPKDQPAERP